MLVKGFLPVFSLVYFLQPIFKASIRFSLCFLLFRENVFDILSISSSKPKVNSSLSETGRPLNDNIGLL